MQIEVKPSNLRFKYRRKKEFRDQPKFTGKPDTAPFDAEDLYEVIPMLEAVMTALGTSSDRDLEELEELMASQMPSFIRTREETYDFLYHCMADRMGLGG